MERRRAADEDLLNAQHVEIPETADEFWKLRDELLAQATEQLAQGRPQPGGVHRPRVRAEGRPHRPPRRRQGTQARRARRLGATGVRARDARPHLHGSRCRGRRSPLHRRTSGPEARPDPLAARHRCCAATGSAAAIQIRVGPRDTSGTTGASETDDVDSRYRTASVPSIVNRWHPAPTQRCSAATGMGDDADGSGRGAGELQREIRMVGVCVLVGTCRFRAPSFRTSRRVDRQSARGVRRRGRGNRARPRCVRSAPLLRRSAWCAGDPTAAGQR